jgi:hypothetical protein
MTLRRSYASAPVRQGIALSRGQEKWTFIRDQDGDRIHLGRVEGVGGLDGESFHQQDASTVKDLAALAGTMMRLPASQPEISDETRTMLNSLGYVH